MYDFFSRLEGLLRDTDRRSRWLLVLLIAALPCVDLAAFTWVTANTMVSRDQWHFMPMIRDYFAGQFHAFSLWDSHSQHRTPGYKLLFLVNAIFFKLNLRFEIVLGLIALTTSVLLLMKRFRDTLPAAGAPRTMLLGLVAMALVGFNLNQWYNTVYALTALAGYAGVLCFVWLWLMLDNQLRQGTSAWKTAGLCLALAFSLMSFAAGMGPALIATLLLVPSAIMVLERRVDRGNLVLLGWLLLCSLACELVYWKTPGVKIESPHSQPFMTVFMQDPVAVLEYAVLAFASSAIPADAMDKHFHELGHLLNLLTGVGIICIYATCAFTYLRLRMWKASYLPGFLMAFSTLFILSTLIVRLPSAGVGTSEAPRYVLYSQLGLIGCLWIVFHWFAGHGGPRPAVFNKLFNPTSCFIAAALLYMLGLAALWGVYPYLLRNNERGVQEVLTGDFSQQRDWLCPNPKLCSDGRATLARYQLNVFADQPQAGTDGKPQP
jgi:hypothetical protein